jgi:hypothetical protein
MLRLDPAPLWSFSREARHDLLPLALLAAGVGEEDTVRILLTLEPAIALSVATVFRLVRLFRETERPTAVYLVEAILGVARAPNSGRHVPLTAPESERFAPALPMRRVPVARQDTERNAAR